MQFTGQGIILRNTTIGDLDEYILKTEKNPENAKFINVWTRDQHLDVIQDKSKFHLTVTESYSAERIGYVIMMKNPYNSIEFRRLVISRKDMGFGRKVVQLVKKIAFDHLKAHRLWLDVIEFNSRAQHLYLDEGFTKEGILRHAYQAADKSYHNLFIMSILSSEYELENIK